jgi:hypothetical protein
MFLIYSSSRFHQIIAFSFFQSPLTEAVTSDGETKSNNVENETQNTKNETPTKSFLAVAAVDDLKLSFAEGFAAVQFVVLPSSEARDGDDPAENRNTSKEDDDEGVASHIVQVEFEGDHNQREDDDTGDNCREDETAIDVVGPTKGVGGDSAIDSPKDVSPISSDASSFRAFPEEAVISVVTVDTASVPIVGQEGDHS